jgi:hypothetical protein
MHPGPIASLGRVLGNRETLYKYLNPHLTAIASSSGIYLIDAVSGSLVWSASHAGEVAAGGCVMATVTENWLVYAFRDADLPGAVTRVVSVELYSRGESNRCVHGQRSLPLLHIDQNLFVLLARDRGARCLHALLRLPAGRAIARYDADAKWYLLTRSARCVGLLSRIDGIFK